MANNMSDYLESKLVNNFFRTTTYSRPANLWIALSTGTMTDSNTGSSMSEVSGGSYARKGGATVDPLDATWDAPSSTDGHTSNTSDITFVTATGSWGTVTGMAITDASSSGNILFFGTLSSSKAVGSSDTFKFLAGDIDVTFS